MDNSCKNITLGLSILASASNVPIVSFEDFIPKKGKEILLFVCTPQSRAGYLLHLIHSSLVRVSAERLSDPVYKRNRTGSFRVMFIEYGINMSICIVYGW